MVVTGPPWCWLATSLRGVSPARDDIRTGRIVVVGIDVTMRPSAAPLSNVFVMAQLSARLVVVLAGIDVTTGPSAPLANVVAIPQLSAKLVVAKVGGAMGLPCCP